LFGTVYVLQRYHARRKLAVQRMEREVEEKIAQLAMLEQENRQLKWHAHILENMLLDMDKQVRQQMWMCGPGWIDSMLPSRCVQGSCIMLLGAEQQVWGPVLIVVGAWGMYRTCCLRWAAGAKSRTGQSADFGPSLLSPLC
jgi:hypothetical protein